MKKIFLFLSLYFATLTVQAQTLKINILALRNAKGTIRVAFYNTSESFDNEKALFVKTISKSDVTKGAISVSYTGIKPGTYGIAILDDENNNQKMDYGLMLPKEGFGFSNYYHTGMSRPKFDSFDFIFGSEDKVIEIKVRYM